jgi:RNA polymerase sigma-32 factor
MEDLAYEYPTKEWSDRASDCPKEVRKSIRQQPKPGDMPSHDYLQLYLVEIGRYPLLTREEELELARRVKAHNDENAVNRLITSNLRLVVKIAKDLSRYWKKDLLDLIQEGNLGLLKAAKKFDPDKGTKFSYYASFWIKAYMLSFIMDNWKLVKIGTTQSQRKLFFNMAKERNRLTAKGVAPRPKLVAKRLGVKEEEVVEMTHRLSNDLSLHASVGNESKETREVYLEDPSAAVDEQISDEQVQVLFSKKLNEFRKRLSEREVDILDSRILAEKPVILRKLGERHQISRERVRQIQKKIIENIKEWSKEEIPNFEEVYRNVGNTVVTLRK